jgi:hypothetical protein
MPYGMVPTMSEVSFIDTLPADKQALHDIRFRFRINNIWNTITTTHPELEHNTEQGHIS